MKVNITMTEVQYYEHTQEMELTTLEYATYCKTGRLPFDKEFDVKTDFDNAGVIVDGGHQVTEQTITEIKPI